MDNREKLVQRKCVDCRRLLALHSRGDDHLKCEGCPHFGEVSNTSVENNFEVFTNTSSKSLLSSSQSCKLATSMICNSRFPPYKKNSETKSQQESAAVALPRMLGSYSIHQRIFTRGFFLSIGDIVSIHSEGVEYYAQITVFLENLFCEKFAALIWLIPTTMRTNSALGFDPFAFTYGPQDESFHDVDLLKFVMHPPTQFYKRFIPFVPKSIDLSLGIKQKC